MKTEYQLWRKPDGKVSYEQQGQFASLETAAAAAAERDAIPAISGPEAWSLTPDGEHWTVPDHLYPHAGAARWLIGSARVPETDADRIELAIDLAVTYSRYDGSHHKSWVFDQMVRVLAGDRYEQVVAAAPQGWSEGVAP